MTLHEYTDFVFYLAHAAFFTSLLIALLVAGAYTLYHLACAVRLGCKRLIRKYARKARPRRADKR